MALLNVLKGLAIALGAYFAPIKMLIISAAALVVCDTISGVLAAREKGEKITAAKLRRTVSKFVVYTVGILAGHATQALVPTLGFPMASLIAASVGLVETKSVLENIGIITGMPIFQTLLDKLGSSNDLKKVEEPKTPAGQGPGPTGEGV